MNAAIKREVETILGARAIALPEVQDLAAAAATLAALPGFPMTADAVIGLHESLGALDVPARNIREIVRYAVLDFVAWPGFAAIRRRVIDEAGEPEVLAVAA